MLPFFLISVAVLIGDKGAMGQGSAILGMVEGGYQKDESKQATNATIGQGTINTNSDISGLNRDITQSQVLLSDEHTKVSVAVPIVAPEVMKSAINEIGKKISESLAQNDVAASTVKKVEVAPRDENTEKLLKTEARFENLSNEGTVSFVTREVDGKTQHDLVFTDSNGKSTYFGEANSLYESFAMSIIFNSYRRRSRY